MRIFALGVTLLAGCSLAVKGPPQTTSTVQETDCTDSYVLPAVDVALFAASVVATVLALRRDTECGALDCLAVPAGIAGGIAFPIVAADGFDKVHRCRQYRASLPH